MNILSTLLTAVIGISVLSFLILIHEFGHFLAARYFGVKVKEFGIGFPFLGRIFTFKRGETLYSINWLFLGGFVSLYGEESLDEKGPHSFSSQSVWKRIIIAGAGVVVNILFAVLVFTILLASSGFKTDYQSPFENKLPFGKQEPYVLIVGVDENSPAKEAGLKFLDRVLKVNGKEISDVSQLQTLVKENVGNELSLTVENLREENKNREIKVTPRVNPPPGEGALGIGLDEGTRLTYESLPEKIFVGFLHSANMVELQFAGLKKFIGESFEKRSVEPVASKASGPIGVVAVLGILVQNSGSEALKVLATLTALISLLLGIGNLLPLPAVDGGRLFFYYIEALTGKRVSPRVENAIHAIGFFVLIFLLILITINDISKLVHGNIFG